MIPLADQYVFGLEQSKHEAEEKMEAAEKIVRDLCELFGVHHPDCIKLKKEALEKSLALAENELCTTEDQVPPKMESLSLSEAFIRLNDEVRELRRVLRNVLPYAASWLGEYEDNTYRERDEVAEAWKILKETE